MAENPTRRVVIVGAGSAGCVLAARLSEDPEREVLLIEEGDWLEPPGGAGPRDLADDIRDVGSLSLAFDSKRSRAISTATTNHLDADPRNLRVGSVVGGSSAVNGGYFIRATAGDQRGWAESAGDAFLPEAMAQKFAILERDLDFGAAPGHGSSGPVPVKRDVEVLHAASEAFLEASFDRGFAYEEDKNGVSAPAQTASGAIGPVPFNVDGTLRADIGSCYLVPAAMSGRPNLVVLTNTRVARVVLVRGRAVGVEADSDAGRTVIPADLVVLTAGAVGSPGLLLASGIGPSAIVAASGTRVERELAGVGSNLFNHPTIDLQYLPEIDVEAVEHARGVTASFMQLVLHTSADNGSPEFELMATRRPYGAVTGLDRSDPNLSMRVTLLNPQGRGQVSMADPGKAGVRGGVGINHSPLASQADREALREGFRLAVDILMSSSFNGIVAPSSVRELVNIAAASSTSDLDRWLDRQTGFAFHPMGTCAMGTTERAVVDSRFRVRGLEALAVVDASVIPNGLSRGPAATVVALAEAAAEAIAQEW